MNRKLFVTSFLITLLQSQAAYSGAFGVTGKFQFDLGASSGGPHSRSGDPSSAVTGEISENLSRKCTAAKMEEKKVPHLSLTLLKELMNNSEDFKVTSIGENKHRIQIPNIVSAGCLDGLVPEKVKVENGLGIAFKLEPNNGPYKGFEQLKACFKEKGLLDAAGEKLDATKVEKGHLTDFSWDIDVSSSIDESSVQSKKLFFISPDYDPSGLNSPHWKDDGIPIHEPGFGECYAVENHIEDGYKIYQNRTVTEAYAACSSNDLKRMLDAYKNLEVAGNSGPVFEIAKKALEIAMKDQLEENYEKIIQELRDYNKDELKDAFTKMNKGKLDHDEAEDVVKGYAEILNKLDEQVINPAIREIKQLLADREDASEDEKKDIDRRIKDLNEIIGEYDKKKVALGAERAKAIAKKFALVDEGAEDIVGFALKSKFWGKVGEGRRQISIDKAKSEITKGLKNFERIAEKWERDYDDYEDANSGDYGPSREAGRQMLRYRQAKDRAYQRYQQQEQKYASYCQQGMFGVQNPVRCQRYMSPQARQQRQRRFLQQREGLLKRENFYQNRYDHFDQIATNARMRDREGGFGDDPFFSDYGFSNFDDPFYMDYNQFDGGGYSDYSMYSANAGNMPYYGQGQYGNQLPYNGGSPYNLGGNGTGRYPAQGQYNTGYNQNFMNQPYGNMPPQYPMMP